MVARSSPGFEPDDVRIELISALYLVLWPTIIITFVFVSVAAFSFSQSDASSRGWLMAIAVSGAAAAIYKLLLLLRFKSRSQPALTVAQARWWERRHAYCGWVFSVAVGSLTALNFSNPSPLPQLLATALLFGHSSGIVVRGLVRPRTCTISLVLTVAPVVVAAAMRGDLGHYLLAVTCTLFMLGGLESVWSGYNGLRRQIDERNDLASVARHDPLTGLANRLGLREGFDRLMRASDEDTKLAVHCLDLNRFKPVNDRYGHPAGDELLRQIAGRIRRSIGPGNVAARTGGDEFVVVQNRVRNHNDAEVFADALNRAISAPYSAKGHVISVGVSIGSAVAGVADISLAGLISEADDALLIAKRDACRVFAAVEAR
ncbi:MULTISPECIES: GGDEF domain-containing protein [Sphingosinicellaceae]|uniref:GGDEF domain-containing protein n=1 Tax=Sphingosinicellaceae TaxID=2820280 RepID=UPI001C1DDAE5|nr:MULTISPECIES: GGDEF domain-containing protein [Polymorphobacter]QYE34984.1 GGDEF domain-containing protein [Polymorphobacter sp. PAMC 29334]UAJ11665.1 GGDEF domain-containing protein [Polymorphobacter megasporae]